MRLVIISHTEHYHRDGRIVGWGPTVREIDHLSQLFDSVVHVAPLHEDNPPPSAIPYEASNVRLHPVPPAGGNRFLDKINILRVAPIYIRAIMTQLHSADVVHVRCPANISLIALMLLSFVQRPKMRWVKYAGNWKPTTIESWSYTLQRLLLRWNLHRGLVTVNGSWPGQPPHVFSFLNPSITIEELKHAQTSIMTKKLTHPLRLLFVGRVEEEKGAGRVIDIVQSLRKEGIEALLDIIGEGSQREEYERRVRQMGMESYIQFLGAVPRRNINDSYARAHIMLLPTNSEGWPKVLSEAMAFGVVPVASSVSSIPQVLAETGAGIAVQNGDPYKFVHAIREMVLSPSIWEQKSRAGHAAASRFTYVCYLEELDRLFSRAWHNWEKS